MELSYKHGDVIVFLFCCSRLCAEPLKVATAKL